MLIFDMRDEMDLLTTFATSVLGLKTGSDSGTGPLAGRHNLVNETGCPIRYCLEKQPN